MFDKVLIRLTARVTIVQTIQLVDNTYTVEDIVAGLTAGTMETTVGHAALKPGYARVLDWSGDDPDAEPKLVGYIIEQNLDDDFSDDNIYEKFEAVVE